MRCERVLHIFRSSVTGAHPPLRIAGPATRAARPCPSLCIARNFRCGLLYYPSAICDTTSNLHNYVFLKALYHNLVSERKTVSAYPYFSYAQGNVLISPRMALLQLQLQAKCRNIVLKTSCAVPLVVALDNPIHFGHTVQWELDYATIGLIQLEGVQVVHQLAMNIRVIVIRCQLRQVHSSVQLECKLLKHFLQLHFPILVARIEPARTRTQCTWPILLH